MKSREMNLVLMERFPNLQNRYNDEVEWQEGDETGSHVVYGDVFSPYIEEVISDGNDCEIEKIFEFIEEILSMDDQYSSEVILFSVLERLLINKKILKEYKKYFGSCTKKYIELYYNI